MRKFLLTIITIFAFGLLFTSQVWAGVVGSLSIRLEQPKSPTNQNTFDINFVALDVLGRTVTVRCYKKGPSEAALSQFGSDISLLAGGNTGNCVVTSSIISAEGTYQFYANAQADGELVDSSVVSVDYKTSGPGTPSNYSKNKISCDYEIKFRTADDSGKTVKVELYRSENTSFTADSGTRVGSTAIGSNTDGSFLNAGPDCGKTYYYAIRAFDSAGNGSGIIGDVSVKTVSVITVVSPSPTPTYGAIPVVTGAEGGVLGEEAKEEATPAPTGQIEGVTAQPAPEVLPGKIFNLRNLLIGAGAILILILAYYFYRQSKE